MLRDKIIKYVKNKYNTESEYLWASSPNFAVFRNSKNKWYGIIMDVEYEKLNMSGEGKVDIIDVKCPPELCGSLRLIKGFLPAYHMNKEHWITILLDGSVAFEKIKKMIDLSYELSNNK